MLIKSEELVPEEKQAKKIQGPMEKNNSLKARMRIFKNRQACIKKKAMELSILCGVKACVVCFGPDGSVDTWPENPNDVKSVLQNYAESKKIGKKGKKIENHDDLLHGFSGENLKNLLGYVDSKLGEVKSRIEMLKKIKGINNVDKGKELATSYDSGMKASNLEVMTWQPIPDTNSMKEISMLNNKPNYQLIRPDELLGIGVPLQSIYSGDNSMVNETYSSQNCPNFMNFYEDERRYGHGGDFGVHGELGNQIGSGYSMSSYCDSTSSEDPFTSYFGDILWGF